MQADVEVTEDADDNEKNSRSGSVYVRWGSHTCPNIGGTVLLYEGRAGNSHWNEDGGGVNYLCMPNDPDYVTEAVRPGVQGWSYIYGVEYEHPAPNSAQWDHNVPCAVCHAKQRGSKVMIPAKTYCPKKWTMEYKGYLMTQRHIHPSKATFECVDENLESIAGSAGSTDGGSFFNVEASCNGLQCPPYHAERELTCVVCTR